LFPGNAAFGFSGGSGQIAVTTPLGCPWSVFNSNSWITITTETSGTNGGTVGYSVASNTTGLPRSGVFNVANQMFTVTQNPAPEAVKPTVKITSPAPNIRTTDSMISGTARDNAGIATVRVQIGDREFLTASGTNSWSINLREMLVPGTNVVRVKCVDVSGNESVVVTQRFVFVVTSPLIARTSGSGTVTPNYNGRPLELGRAYTVTALPGAGYVFSNWTGGLIAGTSRLTFVMRSNLMLQANFVPNPFRAVKGTYNGLFYSQAVDHGSSGFLSLALTERGTFTARMLAGGRRLSFIGAFDLLGMARSTVPRPGTNALTVELMADLTPGGTQITGRVTDGTFEAGLSANRAVFHPVTNPATNYAGKYTLFFPGNPDPAASPGGDGFGTLTVDRGGNAIFTGTLADGTPVTQRVPLSITGDWPLYVPLYGGKGSLLSGVTFTNAPMDDLAGEFRWIKPALPLTKYYPGGFAQRLPLSGSRYAALSTNAILDITGGLVTFSGGNLDTAFTNHVVLGARNTITNLDANKLTLTFVVPRGLFNGTVNIPGTDRTVLFKGAVHQTQNRAFGFFLGTNQSGQVTLGQ
jgi:hypothetical protein